MKKKINKVITFILVTVLAMSFSCNAFAKEANPLNDTRIIIDESKSQSVSNYSSNNIYKPGTYVFPEFSFTGYNRGAYKTIWGHKMRYTIAFKPLDGNSVDLDVYCMQYGDIQKYKLNCITDSAYKGSDGYYHFTSGWFFIMNTDYCFTYFAQTPGSFNEETGEAEERKVSVKLTIEIQ